MTQYLIGIDVGTGSARAAVFDGSGHCFGVGKCPTILYRDEGQIVEQSGNDVWSAVCHAVKEALEKSNISPSDIVGIGVDATCSLVVVDKEGNPLAVGPSNDPERNIMVWMDHRAADQAIRINETQHRVLDYVGGIISPEMETPKLLWLKENKSEIFKRAAHFFDLTDFITWKATSDLSRSVCTVTCKWTYMAHEESWDESYFNQVGLEELCADNFARIGSKIVDVGTSLGDGLTEAAAHDLGLLVGCPVAAGLIDAHAGGIGTIGAVTEEGSPETRMAYVFGTSACTMTSTKKDAFVPGVWGPYYSAMVPGLWLNEGGQSAAGAAIAHLIKFHPAYPEAKRAAAQSGKSVPDYLIEQAQLSNDELSCGVDLAGQIVVVPEFLGNRAPFADPNARAIISGLGLETNIESLIALYIAGICGLGYGLRQILNAQRAQNIQTDTVVISGGAGESPFVKQLLADAAGIQIVEPNSAEPVMLGAAMLGAVASHMFENIPLAMAGMSSLGNPYNPADGRLGKIHNDRFAAFEALQAAAKLCRN